MTHHFSFLSLASAPALPADVQSHIEGVATGLFVCALCHTFLASRFRHLGSRFPEGSILENLFHLLGEVEVVFGIWAAFLIGYWSFAFGGDSARTYLESVSFTEAMFVFVVMCIASTQPVLNLAQKLLGSIASKLPFPRATAWYFTLLTGGPILGSLITEPAAMAVTALLLLKLFFVQPTSGRFRYTTLGLLFVNVSIGGVLTHFAAPPVLMVSRPWGWDTPFMFENFGWRALCGVIVSASAATFFLRAELSRLSISEARSEETPPWIAIMHILFLAFVVFESHHPILFIPSFLFFLGWCAVTKEFQAELKIRESLLVGFFLGGLVVLGQLQGWWLQPLLTSLSDTTLFWGATALTAITDNAALTYLGTLVPTLSESSKHALLSGAICGGGLTVIANAPNPVGFSMLQESFGEDGIQPSKLFFAALPFTIIAAGFFLI